MRDNRARLNHAAPELVEARTNFLGQDSPKPLVQCNIHSNDAVRNPAVLFSNILASNIVSPVMAMRSNLLLVERVNETQLCAGIYYSVRCCRVVQDCCFPKT